MAKLNLWPVAIMTGLLCFGITFGFPSASVDAAEHNIKVIPYPAGVDPEKEGASSAPKEINHANSTYFSHPSVYDMKNTESRLILTHYPTYQQTNEYTCGPAAALTVLYWYGQHGYDELDLAKAMRTHTTESIGTSVGGIVDFFRSLGWKVNSSLSGKSPATHDEFCDFVQKNLRNGIPIMVEDVVWGGHWRVIIGYDTMNTLSPLDDVLIMADSYDVGDQLQDGYNVANALLFYYSWFDRDILPEIEREKPWVTAYPNSTN